MGGETLIKQSVKKLHLWIKQNGYIGWDPYDGINNPKIAELKVFSPYLHIFLIQLNKHSPLNLRPLLNIQKGVDTKGLALFLQAYSQLYLTTKKKEFLKMANELYKMILERSLVSKYGYHCWASHYYPYVTIGSKLSPDTPDIIGTSNVMKGLALYYKISKKQTIKKLLISTSEFIKSLIEKNAKYTYLLYTPTSKGLIVPNASAEAVEAIYYASQLVTSPLLEDELLESIVKTIIELQNPSGDWIYSISANGKTRHQLDFHQGYIIDGLIGALKLINSSNLKLQIMQSIARGTNFYQKMFTKDGRAYYRYPQLYPTDIHNQAQGIITFTKLWDLFKDKSYLNIAKKIAKWTIENMQDVSGYFYFRKLRFITYKIPYIRWSQAWMMLALATLLSVEGGESSEGSYGRTH